MKSQKTGELIKKLGPDGKPMQVATYKTEDEIVEELKLVCNYFPNDLKGQVITTFLFIFIHNVYSKKIFQFL